MALAPLEVGSRKQPFGVYAIGNWISIHYNPSSSYAKENNPPHLVVCKKLPQALLDADG